MELETYANNPCNMEEYRNELKRAALNGENMLGDVPVCAHRLLEMFRYNDIFKCGYLKYSEHKPDILLDMSRKSVQNAITILLGKRVLFKSKTHGKFWINKFVC